jgi:hypothetical protein
LRLIRLVLTESLVLALLGGLGGIAVGYGGVEFMARFTIPTELPIKIPFRMDTRVLLVSLLLSVLSAVFCGLAPALQSTRADLVKGLKAADVDEPGRKRLWGRNALVVAQVAMSLMLLAASFLVYRGFQHSLREGIGFAKDRVLMARFDPRLVQYNAAQTQQFYKVLAERAREALGVERSALTQTPPLSVADFGRVAFVPDGFQMPRNRENFTSAMDTVDEGFFETLQIPILRGRSFRASDAAEAPRVAVVNAYFAKHYWAGADAVGKRIRLDNFAGTPVEIVGVAQTIMYRDTLDRQMDFVYLPLAQNPVPKMVLLLRTSGDPLQMFKPLKAIVRTVDPNMPMLETRTYEDLYRYAAVDGPGVASKVVAVMGAVGLILAIAGLYGMVAYNVSRRTREIGIRMAIGAGPVHVVRLMMGKGLVLVAIGTAIWLAMGFASDSSGISVHPAARPDLPVAPAMILAMMPYMCRAREFSPGSRRRWRCDTSSSGRISDRDPAPRRESLELAGSPGDDAVRGAGERDNALPPLMLPGRRPAERALASAREIAVEIAVVRGENEGRIALDADVLRGERVAGAGVGADAGEDLHVVAVDEAQAAFGVALHEGLDVFGVDASVLSARLPGVAGVIGELLLLDPDRRLREEVDPAHVIPMGVADDDVGDVFGLDAGELHGFVGAQVVGGRKLLEPGLTVKAGVEQDVAASAADQPDDHSDVDLLVLRRAHHQGRRWKARDRSVANGFNGVIGLPGGCGPGESTEA